MLAQILPELTRLATTRAATPAAAAATATLTTTATTLGHRLVCLQMNYCRCYGLVWQSPKQVLQTKRDVDLVI